MAFATTARFCLCGCGAELYGSRGQGWNSTGTNDRELNGNRFPVHPAAHDVPNRASILLGAAFELGTNGGFLRLSRTLRRGQRLFSCRKTVQNINTCQLFDCGSTQLTQQLTHVEMLGTSVLILLRAILPEFK